MAKLSTPRTRTASGGIDSLGVKKVAANPPRRLRLGAAGAGSPRGPGSSILNSRSMISLRLASLIQYSVRFLVLVGAPLVGALVRVAKGTHHPEGTRCPYQPSPTMRSETTLGDKGEPRRSPSSPRWSYIID